MKITVLGYWGAYPEANEATSGYLLQHNGANILIDCGSGVLSRLQNHIGLEELDSVVLSHYHADHTADIYTLQYGMLIMTHMGRRKKALDIYAPEDEKKLPTLSYGSACISHPISREKKINICGLDFSFTETEHPVPCLAMRITDGFRTLTYTGDSGWSENLVKLATDTNILICECNLYNYQKGAIAGHMTAEEAGNLAKTAGAGELILTHLPHHGDRNKLVSEASAVFGGRITMASSDLCLEL